MTDLYRENYETIVNPKSNVDARFQALAQIVEGVQDDRVAQLAVGNVGTFSKLVRDGAMKSSERGICLGAFRLLLKLTERKGYKQQFEQGKLHVLALDIINDEVFQIVPKVHALAFVYFLLANAELVDELVSIGLTETLFKHTASTIPQIRLFVFESLAIVSQTPKHCGEMLEKDVVRKVKEDCFDLYKEGTQMQAAFFKIINAGLQVVLNITQYPRSMDDFFANFEECYAVVMQPMKEAEVFEKLLSFVELTTVVQADVVADAVIKSLKAFVMTARTLYKYTTVEFRTKLIKYCIKHGVVLRGIYRLRILQILELMAVHEGNLEIIVECGVFHMCETLALEETGGMLNLVVKLLWDLSNGPFQAKEQVARSNCPKVLVKLLKEANYVVPHEKDWEEETPSLCLLTLINLALHGDNIADALEESGCITVFRKLKSEPNVVGMLATLGLAYVFGGDPLVAKVREVPKVDMKVYDLIVETLNHSLIGRSSHGHIIWSVEEITAGMKCLSMKKSNTHVMSKSIPQLVQILHAFSLEENKSRLTLTEMVKARDGKIQNVKIETEGFRNALGTLIHLSYNKYNMITLLQLGKGLTDLLSKLVNEIDLIDEDLLRNIDALLLALENEKRIAKATENSTRRKQRHSSRLNWTKITSASELTAVLDIRDKESQALKAKLEAQEAALKETAEQDG